MSTDMVLDSEKEENDPMWLKLQWARFFTLAGWDWRLFPRPGFDFKVTFPCAHSECGGSHSLLVRVVDKGHYELVESHNKSFDIGRIYREPNPAFFGDGPENTHWQMVHGHGGGEETVDRWIGEWAKSLWERAAHE